MSETIPIEDLIDQLVEGKIDKEQFNILAADRQMRRLEARISNIERFLALDPPPLPDPNLKAGSNSGS